MNMLKISETVSASSYYFSKMTLTIKVSTNCEADSIESVSINLMKLLS